MNLLAAGCHYGARSYAVDALASRERSRSVRREAKVAAAAGPDLAMRVAAAVAAS